MVPVQMEFLTPTLTSIALNLCLQSYCTVVPSTVHIVVVNINGRARETQEPQEPEKLTVPYRPHLLFHITK